jgi:hypothetical protein
MFDFLSQDYFKVNWFGIPLQIIDLGGNFSFGITGDLIILVGYYPKWL